MSVIHIKACIHSVLSNTNIPLLVPCSSGQNHRVPALRPFIPHPTEAWPHLHCEWLPLASPVFMICHPLTHFAHHNAISARMHCKKNHSPLPGLCSTSI